MKLEIHDKESRKRLAAASKIIRLSPVTMQYVIAVRQGKDCFEQSKCVTPNSAGIHKETFCKNKSKCINGNTQRIHGA